MATRTAEDIIASLRACRTPLGSDGRYHLHVSTDLADAYNHPLLKIIVDPKLPKRGDPPRARAVDGAIMAEFTVPKRP